MVGSGPHQAKSRGSQCQDPFFNLEQRGDCEGSIHTTQTSANQFGNRSHPSHKKDTKAMQLEIDHLRRSLHHERRKWAPSNSDYSSNGEEDVSYKHRSRTPLNESFSYDEDYHLERRNRNSSLRDLGNDAMSRALNQIFRSLFTLRIEGGRLPRWFTQPMFTMYNGRTDPMEHVSHFNQRTVVHSKNEALMCKVFPSNLGPVAMRWFWWSGYRFHWFL